MTPLTAVKKPTVEIAHILQKHLEDYKRQYRLGSEHRKILSDLLNCRTAKEARGCIPQKVVSFERVLQ